MADLAADVKARLGTLTRRREPWLQAWQELASVFLPNRATFRSRIGEGERAQEALYDSTPRLAARDLAAAIDGLIKPKTTNWFEPWLLDEDLAKNDTVKKWLEVVAEKMWQSIYRPEARFIQRSAEVDDSLVVFGWGTLWTSENRTRNGLLFRSFHNKDVALDEDGDGVIDTISVEEELTARQAILRFGEDGVHKEIRECAYRDDKVSRDKLFKFAQIVMPATDALAGRIGARGFPFVSITMNTDFDHIVSKGGYHEFPAAVPRWETEAGQVYARSPAMLALPDALTLNAISKTLLVGGERAADPPLMVPSDAFISPVRTFPGGISVFDTQALVDGNLNTPVFRGAYLREFLHLLPNGFSTPTTTTLAFIKAGYNVAFEPIDARQRTGESKIRFARDGVKFFVIILKIVTLFSPLRVFLPVSLTAFTLGASYAAWTIATQSHVTNSSVLLILLAVIVFLVGLVSEQIAAMRFEGRQ